MTLQEQLADDRRLVAEAVRALSRRTRFPIAFGGLIENGTARMSAFFGNHTDSLDGLAVRPERGLGGRAMIEMRPRMTGDYRTARQITHDYDGYILGEGIGTLIAAPIVVDGKPRGVLYGGAWGRWNIGGVAAAPAVRVADEVAAELSVRDETRRRLSGLQDADAGPALSPGHREELRESYAELRRIAADIDDADIRARLADVERRLAALSGIAQAPRTEPVPQIRLSPREVDVLARAALGETNAEIGALLGLREGTVKAYLSAAMAKLDASTRHAAVVRARKWGLLP
ncbi:LuxR C-terminal-related transcriptional regulator [Microbacterium marinilacus]|uniref:LuxR C-terminal-related transcriptional regulator n=1 Tax=Microbacterium marinilacus TaxID=415209 RepID=A0ABP7BFP1_9MICO|nr:LuxR C-terminal-related transcriptional regulator [Microbacterium marinilacus]MBY0688911.1 LuxR C-terminal-related transcriptional regulator [Microbacterium marinilacus]